MYNNITELTNHISRDPRSYIIQEEVPNMLLINNRKFVLRNWIVIVDNKFYITSSGTIIVHEFEYYNNSNNRKVHIEHGNNTEFLFYREQSFYKNTFVKIFKSCSEIFNIIKTKLHFRKNCYQVMGLDFLIDRNYEPFLIEVNSRPNMADSRSASGVNMKEFFINFLDDIVIKKLNNQTIIDTDYFTELKCYKVLIFKIPKKISNSDIPVVVIDNNNFLDIKDEYNMNVKFFNKIKIDNDTYNKYLDKGLINNDRYKLRLEQVSSWMSHLHIWKEMIRDNVDKILVLEDTCKFVNDFNKSYNEILTKSKSIIGKFVKNNK